MEKIKIIPYLVPTDKRSPLVRNNIQEGLFLVGGQGILAEKRMGDCTNQHLYFTTDEEIKEGDWRLYYNTLKIAKTTKADLPIIKYYSEECRKIVATTNPELTNCPKCNGTGERFDTICCKEYHSSIAKIPESFINQYIEKYNAGNKIEEVWLECNHYPISPNGNIVGTNYEYPFTQLKSNFTIKTTLKLNPEGYVIPVEKKEDRLDKIEKAIRFLSKEIGYSIVVNNILD